MQNCQEQSQSRNAKILQEMINNTLLVPASTNTNYGFYTRIKWNDTKKSMIDFILTTTPITANTSNLMIDEGHYRVKSKKELEHSTLLVNLKINMVGRAECIEKWKVDNSEGWTKFNSVLENMANSRETNAIKYEELEETIRNSLRKP